MYDSWGMEQQSFLSFWTFFCAFTPPNNTENQNFLKRWKSTQSYYLFTHVGKWKSYNIWFLRYGVWRTQFFVILNRFLPFYPLTTQKIKMLKKWKKITWRYYHFTYGYHKWQSYRYGSCNMEHGKHNFLSFWTIFCPYNKIKSKSFIVKERVIYNIYHSQNIFLENIIGLIRICMLG